MLLRLTHILFAAVWLAAFVSCNNNYAIKSKGGDTLNIQYARLLTIERFDEYKLVTIADPWKENAVLHRYALVERGAEIPSGLDAGVTVLRVPLKRICVSTSVHVNVFKQLNALENVASVCDTEYILDSLVLARVKNGTIGNAGSSMNPNIEQIIAFDTDALLMSPFKGTSYGLLEKTGLPIVECADYMETSALGRAEWIKFYGMLVGKEAQSIEYFNGVRDRYLRLKTSAAKAAERPRLLVDILNGSAWFQPGGNSIYGTMFRDAA
ncbi:MAG: ABC transporter substrate-binding protein, partial [Bacteroidaceae bacterium]